MLRINLLPPYVSQRRLTSKLVVLFSTLFVVTLAALLAWYFVLAPQYGIIKAKADEAEAKKTNIESLKSQATSTLAAIGPIQGKLDFVNAVKAYNVKYVALYRNIARYTSPKILYNSMAVSGTTLSISAYTPNIILLGRYLQVMYTEPDVTAVSISALPAYASASPDKPVQVSIPAGVIANMPGFGLVGSYTVDKGVITKLQRPGTNAQQGPGGMPGGIPGAGFGGPGGAGGQAGTKPFDPKYDGFPFSVTATLKEPLVPPTYGAAGGAAGTRGPGAAGMPPGMTGMPPGMGGMPPGIGGMPPGAGGSPPGPGGRTDPRAGTR